MDEIADLSDTINPKSQQLNADDLAIIPSMTIKVTGVKRGGSKDQPIVIEFEGMEGRPFKPCLTMRRVLFAAWTSDGNKWIGRSMKLYCDPNVKFGGEKVGGIRISALSDIDKPIRLLLSTSKSKRSEYNINKLEPYPDKEFNEKHLNWIAAIKEGKMTINEVVEKASALNGPLTDDQIEILKGAINNDS
jgi:hypothetical protein